jgi:hypothetical protein
VKFNIDSLTAKSPIEGGSLPLGEFAHVAATLDDANNSQRSPARTRPRLEPAPVLTSGGRCGASGFPDAAAEGVEPGGPGCRPSPDSRVPAGTAAAGPRLRSAPPERS